MSSTRRAIDDSVYHPERYASSADFEAGLIASQVARRCARLTEKSDRALIWWLHFMSWQPGGLKAVAEILVSRYGGNLGTKQMAKIGKRSGQNYTGEEVKEIRRDLPLALRSQFPLRGEIPRDAFGETHRIRISLRLNADPAEYLSDEAVNLNPEILRLEKQQRTEAEKHPVFYRVEDFLALCCEAAAGDALEAGNEPLDKVLRDLCFNPAVPLHSEQPWFFFKLDCALQSFMSDWIAERATGVVVTSLGKIVHEMLDYTLHSRRMNLLEGDARTGKSFSARTWCEQHPGQARFIEVPVGNDDAGFFRALARGLGIGNFSQYKAGEIKERVESVLLTGDIMVCLDEAQRLWPEMNIRYGVPKRINWLMSMVNKRVPFCLISTPQFLERQIAWERNAGWNSAQFLGRLGLSKRLPVDLSVEDLMAVGSSILPEVESKTLRVLAAYARQSARYLAAIDSVADRARYVASRDGRQTVTTEDVRTAMRESVIPSDSALVRTLEQGKKIKGNGNIQPAPALEPEPEQPPVAPPARAIRPVAEIGTTMRRVGDVAELVQD